MARISPEEIVAFAKRRRRIATRSSSCTAVRTAGVAKIEAAIGRPVVTSNLATAWACLRLCGDETARPALGRLMTCAYPGGDA